MLVTNDTQDRDFVAGEMRVVAAWGDSKTFSYHGSNRIATTVTFIPQPLDSNNYEKLLPNASAPGLHIYEFRMRNFTVPCKFSEKESLYVCFIFSILSD